MQLTGNVTLGKIPNWGLRKPVEPLRMILNEFCMSAEQTMAETSLKTARSTVRCFLFEMEDHGFCTPADFSQVNVNGCVASFALHYAGGLGSAISCVRLFLHFFV